MSKARNLAALLGGGSTGVVQFGGTGAIQVPGGTTAQRPTPANGEIRYNSDLLAVEVYAGGQWGTIAPPPTISSVSPTAYNGEQGTTFTITGTNFTNDATVTFIASDSTTYTAAVVTSVNGTTLTATTPQDFTVAQGPLSIKVVQGSGNATLSSAVNTGGTPVWTTASGSLASVYEYVSGVSVSILATDPDAGATLSYSVTSGALPTGLSLNSGTGAITGSIASVSSTTTNNFTVTATDNAGNQTARAFSITTKPEPSFALFGTGFDHGALITSGLATTITNTGAGAQGAGQSAWSSWTSNIATDSNLNGFPGSTSINDSDSMCSIILNKPTRVYLFRQSGWNLVSTAGWTSYNSTNYVETANQNFYKDFSAGIHYLDNNSAMYIASGAVLPSVVCGLSNMNRGNGVNWFSPGYYGVDTLYQFSSGMHVRAWDWITGSSAASARIWFFVMEKDSSVSSKFYVRAGWMFVDNNPGDGLRRTLRTEDATSTVGSVDATTKKYVVPSSGHLASGQYYLGWYSGDPNGGTQPNAAIRVLYSEGTPAANAGGGTVHYILSSTAPSSGLSLTFTSLNTGRGMCIAAHGFN